MSRHGTDSRYKSGCREDCCRTAHAEATKRYREAQQRPLGHRRNRTLEIEYAIANGQPPSKIMERFALTYEDYRALVDGMAMGTGVEAPDVPADGVAVERIISGAVVIPSGRALSAEFVEAVRVLAGRGMSDTDIGVRLSRSPSAICQLRLRNDIPGGYPEPEGLLRRRSASRKDEAA